MSENKRIAGVQYTSEQRAWLRSEAKRIGDTIASVQRGLVQTNIKKVR